MSARTWFRECAFRLTRVRCTLRARAELNAMDDRELRDLGLGRSDIEAVLSGRFDDETAPCSRAAPDSRGALRR
ncbi:DUF1127 domain-containing protein [Methyloversatilis sp.]|uniref:DUF1127 domain-containing protein n=1 Tax=Methyloversatilis sp. TaxID=2569862 RepID=UPI0035AED37E